MKSNALVAIVLCFVIAGSFVTIFSNESCKASGNEIYVDCSFHGYSDGSADKPYESIQYAIDVADEEDTIYVFSGTYDETLIINKKVKLWGSIDGKETIIDTRTDKRYTVEITADHAELQDFTISDSKDYKTSPIGALICIKSDNVIIQGNRINHTNSWGIYLDSTSSGSVVSGNTVNDTEKGIYAFSSDTNDIFNNDISNCSKYAVQVTSSQNNRLYGNSIRNSSHGMYIEGCNGINITNNTVTGTEYHGIYLYQSNDGNVKNNEVIKNDGDGIYLDSTAFEISNNKLDANQRGITLVGSDNEIRNNSLSNSSGSGIYAYSSSKNNIIYLNRFLDNGKTAQESGGNQWYYENQGNYWSDYSEVDRDLDGIGDTYYTTGGVLDKYPLGYFLKPPEKPSNPNPEDTEDGVGLRITLQVDIGDPDSDQLTVYFYNADTHALIDTDKRVQSGGTATCTFTLAFNTTFAWYAIANDSKLENQSDPWFFVTMTTPPDNEPPVADAGGPYSAGAGQVIVFDGSGSNDSDGEIDFYRWNFGDGTSEILAKSPDHTYSATGTYEVTLTIIDNDGTTDTDIIEVTIGEYVNKKPTANADGPYQGVTGESITFSGSNSSDSDGSITNYTWNFGGNTLGYDETITHKYSKAGSYLVTLTVTDDDGDTHAETTSVTVKENEAPGFEIIFFVIATTILLFWKRIKKTMKN